MAGSLNDEDWAEILEDINDAIEYLASKNRKSSRNDINLDADPRNRNWLRIVRIYRLAGYKLPSWAAMWLAQISVRHDESTFWRSVKKVASEMALEKFKK